MSLRLGDFFADPNEINKLIESSDSLLKRIITFKIGSKEVLWKPPHFSETKQESSQTGLYSFNVKEKDFNIQLLFVNPWNISSSESLDISICESHLHGKFKGRCLELTI